MRSAVDPKVTEEATDRGQFASEAEIDTVEDGCDAQALSGTMDGPRINDQVSVAEEKATVRLCLYQMIRLKYARGC